MLPLTTDLRCGISGDRPGDHQPRIHGDILRCAASHRPGRTAPPLRRRQSQYSPWNGAALVLYLVVFVITIGVNLPRAAEIKGAGDVNNMTDPHGVLKRFDEVRWVR
jgi:hypothetical protein